MKLLPFSDNEIALRWKTSLSDETNTLSVAIREAAQLRAANIEAAINEVAAEIDVQSSATSTHIRARSPTSADSFPPSPQSENGVERRYIDDNDDNGNEDSNENEDENPHEEDYDGDEDQEHDDGDDRMTRWRLHHRSGMWHLHEGDDRPLQRRRYNRD
jgi:hypothetical protein